MNEEAIHRPPIAARLFLRMHPLQRILLSLLFSVATWLVVLGRTGQTIKLMLGWIAFSFTYVLTGWIILFLRPVADIRKTAKKDDGSQWFVFLMVIISSFASILMVLLLMISHSAPASHATFVFVSITGILLAWFMVHTLYTFHYAHIYYDAAPHDHTKDAGGLTFPNEEEPDYIDFAYFSFVIGCTFQVSDVEITTRQLRRTVLLHQLISFGLNTIVVALTINLIAGLMK